MNFFNQKSKARLKEFEQAVIHAAAKPEHGQPWALSPFLYARIKARIESERRRSAAHLQTAFTEAVWRYSPALVLVTCATFVLFWVVSFSIGKPLVQHDLRLEMSDEFESVVVTDSLSLSRDEALATIMTSERGGDPQ